MSERIYLTERNEEIRKMRYECHMKVERIVSLINGKYPGFTVTRGRVCQIAPDNDLVGTSTVIPAQC